MLIPLTGLSGICFGWMRGSCQRLMKIVTTSLLLMDLYPRYVADELSGVIKDLCI